MVTVDVATFWEAAKQAISQRLGDRFIVRRIGGSADIVDMVMAVILSEDKTGTFGLPWLQERMPETKPWIGGHTVLVDMDGAPKAVIETMELTPTPLGGITEEHLQLEGPAVRTLDLWRSIHIEYWTTLLAPYDLEPTEDMPVNVERFELLYPLANATAD